MLVCDCYASGSKRCTCGAVRDGVVTNGAALRIPLMMKDSAPPAIRKELTMMNDAEVKAMRDSVRGMLAAKAAALPIYDNVRGLTVSGMSAPEYYAVLDGAVRNPPTEAFIDKAAHQELYERRVSNAWKAA